MESKTVSAVESFKHEKKFLGTVWIEILDQIRDIENLLEMVGLQCKAPGAVITSRIRFLNFSNQFYVIANSATVTKYDVVKMR